MMIAAKQKQIDVRCALRIGQRLCSAWTLTTRTYDVCDVPDNRGIVMRGRWFHELAIASGKSTDVAGERKQNLLIGHRDWKALGHNDRRNAACGLGHG
jgi:hypothetical protein